MSEAACAVCRQQPIRFGVLCSDCANELRGSVITPEQLVLRVAQTTNAALVDVWGRVFRLAPITTIGRDFEADGLRILDGSISRAHARISCIANRWVARDLESMNGTFRDDVRIAGEIELQDGERIRFGAVTFFFLEQAPDVPDDSEALVGYTVRSPVSCTSTTDRDPLPPIKLRLQEPSGGGGGLLAIEGKQVQLTVPQFELLSILVTRMNAERERAEQQRGFVAANELAECLSLDSSLPNEDHVRQLVRRLRRALAKAGIGNLVETRYGLGYRFAGTPQPS